ncbi:MAG TPA: hypothetical protein VGH99_11195 [Pseudonocardia sp.]|jgi:hypothetical protein
MGGVDEVAGDYEPARSVRLPVELPPGLHRRLTAWCRETARRLDVPGVARGDVLEAMLEHLVLDEGATDAVRERLADRLRVEHRPAATRPRLP